MNQPKKWRETMDPFTLKFSNFQFQEVLGYPHAGNDVFYISGLDMHGNKTKAFLKVERQKTADIEREVKIIKNIGLPISPIIIDYSFKEPKYLLTREAEGNRLSYIVGDNKEMESLRYMEAYGKLLADIHNLEIKADPIKPRDFTFPPEFYEENGLEFIEEYLLHSQVEGTRCFIHGDCHYANILWKDYKVSCLLDYELSGYGIREYDLAWALILRPGQKFLKAEKERQLFLKSYSRYHNYSKGAFDYYMVQFAMVFYRIASNEEDKEYRDYLVQMIKGIIGYKDIVERGYRV